MRQLIAALGTAAILTSTIAVHAQNAPEPGATSEASKPAAKAKETPKKPATVRGEILDLGCYLARGLRGPMHRDCALKCLSSGVPMGLITADSLVYLLTQVHGRAMAPAGYTNPDMFQQCKQWPAMNVEVSGWTFERKGVRIMEVSKAALLPAPTAGASQ